MSLQNRLSQFWAWLSPTITCTGVVVGKQFQKAYKAPSAGSIQAVEDSSVPCDISHPDQWFVLVRVGHRYGAKEVSQELHDELSNGDEVTVVYEDVPFFRNFFPIEFDSIVRA